MAPSRQKRVQKYCFFLTYANIFAFFCKIYCILLYKVAKYSCSGCPGVGINSALSNIPSALKSMIVEYPERAMICFAPKSAEVNSESVIYGRMVIFPRLIRVLGRCISPCTISTCSSVPEYRAIISFSNKVRWGSRPERTATISNGDW